MGTSDLPKRRRTFVPVPDSQRFRITKHCPYDPDKVAEYVSYKAWRAVQEAAARKPTRTLSAKEIQEALDHAGLTGHENPRTFREIITEFALHGVTEDA